MFDPKKPHGVIHGDLNVRYEQDGKVYRHDGTEYRETGKAPAQRKPALEAQPPAEKIDGSALSQVAQQTSEA